MPSPAKGTVSDDVKTMLGSVKQLTKFEMDTENGIHMGILFY
jgi:ribosomal protein L1